MTIDDAKRKKVSFRSMCLALVLFPLTLVVTCLTVVGGGRLCHLSPPLSDREAVASLWRCMVSFWITIMLIYGYWSGGRETSTSRTQRKFVLRTLAREDAKRSRRRDNIPIPFEFDYGQYENNMVALVSVLLTISLFGILIYAFWTLETC